MWMAIVLITAMTVALVRGGSLIHLADIRMSRGYLLLVALAIQYAAVFVPEEAREWGLAMILFSYIPILAVTTKNRKSPGMILATTGVLMNFLVIALNSGMPVLREAVAVAAEVADPDLTSLGFKHVILDANTALPFLADVIPLRVLGVPQVISLGDVFLAIGFGIFLESELRRPVGWFERSSRKKKRVKS